MTKTYQWQLLTSEQLAQAFIDSNASFRRMKSHYKSKNNVIMQARMEHAEALAKEVKNGTFEVTKNG